MTARWLELEPVWRMGTIVLAVLVTASLVVLVLRLAKPSLRLGEVVSRIRSWWMMAAVFFAAITIHPGASVVFFGLLSFWALKEYFSLLNTRSVDRAALVLAYLAVPVQYAWVWIGWYGMFIVFIPVYMFLLLPLRLVLTGEPRGFVRAAAEIQWGLMAFVFGISHLGFLLKMGPVASKPGIDGRSLLLFLVFVVEMSDVLQFCWGKLAGRRRVIPSISPNKTWEGLIGGILTAVGLSLLIRFLTPFSVGECMGVAAMVTLLGFFGDIVLSAVKRDFGVKDFSAALPGHGGVLDRVDSLCYAAPVFFHYIRYFHYG